MKNIIYIAILTLTFFSCKAQILPLEQYVDYIDAENGLPDNITYVKDVNNHLDKYVGIWKGTFNNKHYEFRITKVTHTSLSNIKTDELRIRYKIVRGGVVVEDTTTLPDNNYLVMSGDYLAKGGGYYVLLYLGRNAACGQEGSVFIHTRDHDTKLAVTITYARDVVNVPCPTPPYEKIIGTQKDTIILTKQ